MVADGHLGINAAAFVEQHFYRLLHPLIPLELPDFENRRGRSDDDMMHETRFLIFNPMT